MSIVNIYDRRKQSKSPIMHVFNSSQEFYIPPGFKSCDIFCVGGGSAAYDLVYHKYGSSTSGGGSLTNYINYIFGGGSGGFCRTIRNININPKDKLDIKVGKGGVPFFTSLPSPTSASDTSYIGYYKADIYESDYDEYRRYNSSGSVTSRVQYNNGRFRKVIGVREYGRKTKYWVWVFEVVSAKNVCKGENSFVKVNNRIIAEAKGGGSGRFTLYPDRLNSAYTDSSIRNGWTQERPYKNLIYNVPSDYNGGKLVDYKGQGTDWRWTASMNDRINGYYNTANDTGGNLGGGGFAFSYQYRASSDRIYVYAPSGLFCGGPGETDGGIIINSNDRFEKPNINFWQLMFNSSFFYNGTYNMFSGKSEDNDFAWKYNKTKDIFKTYYDLFEKTSFNFIETNKQYSSWQSSKYTESNSVRTIKYDNNYILGNQKTLSYWLGQDNTREFGETNGNKFAGGGGGAFYFKAKGTYEKMLQMLDQYNNYKYKNKGGEGGGGNGGYLELVKEGTRYNYVWHDGEDGAPNTGGGGGAAAYQGVESNRGWENPRKSKPGKGGSGVVMIRLFPSENRSINVDWERNKIIHN